MTRNVFFNGEALPDDGDDYIAVPKGNDRMWKITLYNRGRTQTGTATIYRMLALFECAKKRWPHCCKSPPSRTTLMIRRERAGKVVAIIEPLTGPVASVATKQ